MWTGVLSDWELSKPVDVEEVASRATQAERMVCLPDSHVVLRWVLTSAQGTFQFMSVNLLNHVAKPVHISDELESFFHVLVYYAVRNLHSNCKDVDSWIDNYFHKYSGPERELCCGQKSYTMEVTGQLRTRILEGPLVFGSPMDYVLHTISKSLRAHYKVMGYEALKASAELPCPEPTCLSKEPQPPVVLAPMSDDFKDHPDVAQWEAEWEAAMAQPPVDDSPTPEDRELAARMSDHKFMLKLISKQLWNSHWRIDDRTLKKQDSNAFLRKTKPRSPDAQPPAPLASNKRQRTSGPERTVALSQCLDASSRRTFNQSRTHPVYTKR